MFNLSDFQRRGNDIVLKFFETVDSPQVYSYADLYRQSSGLSSSIQQLLKTTADVTKQSAGNFNIAILLPVHSPAILPALVA